MSRTTETAKSFVRWLSVVVGMLIGLKVGRTPLETVLLLCLVTFLSMVVLFSLIELVLKIRESND